MKSTIVLVAMIMAAPALQAQMEPHFVFNALNTIASLVRTDPDRARGLVLAFADYVRSKLARPNEFVTLEEELIVRDLDLDKIAEVRNTWQFYRDRRPDAYDDLTRP